MAHRLKNYTNRDKGSCLGQQTNRCEIDCEDEMRLYLLDLFLVPRRL